MSTQPFAGHLDFVLPIDSEPGNQAFFGRDVLQGMVDGIEDFAKERQPRWERGTHRVGSPVMLGCSPWVNDDKLLAAIEELPGACIVVSKHPRSAGGQAGADRLRAVNEHTNGIDLRALSELANMAPTINGAPVIMGPYDTSPDVSLSTFRTMGYRKAGRVLPPIAHAKLALMGNICWTDEHPSGAIVDYVWFSPKRLWVSSANFTYGSRRSLEFGYWTEDANLVQGVKRFLVNLISASEDLDSAADTPNPELTPVEFDNEAMAEAAADYSKPASRTRRCAARIPATTNGESHGSQRNARLRVGRCVGGDRGTSRHRAPSCNPGTCSAEPRGPCRSCPRVRQANP